jgi:hypothetical protein
VKLIGLYSPYPQMGKGTFADELLTVSAPAATVSFADAMRNVVVDFVSDFFPGGEQEVWAWLSDERKDKKLVPVLGVTLRHMLQTIGAAWGRQLIHPDIWVLKAKAALRRLHNYRSVVFDDLRYENEYHMLRKEGAVLVCILRKDAPNAKQHESNARLEGMEFDYYVTNDGDVEELQAKARLIAREEGVLV